MGRRITFEEIDPRSVEAAARGPDPGDIYRNTLAGYQRRQELGEDVFIWKVGGMLLVGPDPIAAYVVQTRPKDDPPLKSFEMVPGEDVPSERPELCREALRLAGKPHPKSGCVVCRTGGLFGCPYDRRGDVRHASTE